MSTTHVRYDGLDFARAVFILMGVFFHSSLIYGEEGAWRVFSAVTSEYFDIIPAVTTKFRMESFYLLSGFFFAMLIARGRSNLLTDRVITIGVPLLVVGLTLNTAMNSISFNRDYEFGWTYFLYGQWLGHLWFIGNLIVYYLLLYVPIKNLLDPQLEFNNKLKVLIVILTPVFATLMKVVVAKSAFIFITFHHLLYYLPYFLLGSFAYKYKGEFFALLKPKIFVALFFCYVLLFVSFCFFFSNEKLQQGFEHLIRIMAIISAIGFLNYVGSKPNKFIREVVSSSFTIFLLHQPVIIFAFVFLLFKSDLGILYGFLLISMLGVFMPYFFHKIVVERSRVASFLFNGKRLKRCG